MIKIKEALIVEGKYDKIKISQIFDTAIIKTDGFRIYKDKKTTDLIKKLAKNSGVIIITDSDNSGLMIRNYLKNVLGKEENVKHAFVPAVRGKEKRKKAPSASGFLGVEGTEDKKIIDAVLSCGATILSENNEIYEKNEEITRLDLYKMGIYGKDESAVLRKKLLNELCLPENMSVTMLCDVLSTLLGKEKTEETIKNLNK